MSARSSLLEKTETAGEARADEAAGPGKARPNPGLTVTPVTVHNPAAGTARSARCGRREEIPGRRVRGHKACGP